MKFKFLMTSLFFSFLSFPSAANIDNDTQTVIAPLCLLENQSIPYEELAKTNQFMLLNAKTSDLLNLRSKRTLTACGSFRDVTANWNQKRVQNKSQSVRNNAAKIFLQSELTSKAKLLAEPGVSFSISHEKAVNTLLTHYDADTLWKDILNFTSLPNRYSKNANGVKAAEWLRTQAEAMAKTAGRLDITTRFIPTGGSYKQPSLVVTMPGSNPQLDAILIGAHMDTLDGVSPGADDDGSGTITTLSVLRAALKSNMKFERTVYFVWYSAEELGLVGSQVVATEFYNKKIPLRAVLQMDMTGYEATKANKIWLIDDWTNSALSTFVGELAVKYAKVDVGHTKCGYACSDHASWTQKGYATAMPFENKFNDDSPYIHSASDTVDTISLEHMGRFVKIGLGFLGELADPQETI